MDSDSSLDDWGFGRPLRDELEAGNPDDDLTTEAFKKRKKMLMKSLSLNNSQFHLHLMSSKIARLFGRWRSGKEIKVFDETVDLCTEVFSLFVFGKEPEAFPRVDYEHPKTGEKEKMSILRALHRCCLDCDEEYEEAMMYIFPILIKWNVFARTKRNTANIKLLQDKLEHFYYTRNLGKESALFKVFQNDIEEEEEEAVLYMVVDFFLGAIETIPH